MEHKVKFLSLAVSVLLFNASCQPSSSDKSETTTDSTAMSTNTAPISLSDVDSAEDFPNAQLSFGKVSDAVVGDSVKVSFNFNIKNYELKHQTSDQNSGVCNNSDKGQHIHFILDNKPYTALYEPNHEITVAKNSDHYVLVFLSRSYHLSIKNKGAAALYHFHIDETGRMSKLGIPANPMIFYSRPKGDYLGKDAENVLFDFYVWNATLGTDYMVKADINAAGRDTVMLINEWKPYFLKNLPMGKTSITLSLLKDGSLVQGDNTSVTREINLSKDEPMTK